MARYSFNKQTQYTKEEIKTNYYAFQTGGEIYMMGQRYATIPCATIEEYIAHMWTGRTSKSAFVKILKELYIDDEKINIFFSNLGRKGKITIS